MDTFENVFIDKKKNILIPALQRDYVQGGRKDVIVAFLDELLAALRGEKSVDLNYIYGTFEKEAFTPIDGQQRLITLWLLHLYLFCKQGKMFPVELHFASREFADNFSAKLKENLESIINSEDSESTNETIDKRIINSSWFLCGWNHDTTVQNMLETLALIAHKCADADVFVNFKNITFSFYNIGTEGLIDDIYIKMNGRGRPLSYFENLKSWMDEKVVKYFGENDKFTQQWREKIDNEWIDFFWDNRNKLKKHNEEIDEEQTRLFYSILLIYWGQKENKAILSAHIEKMSREDKEQLIFFLKEFLSEDIDETVLTDKIFEILQKEELFLPLYWIEKIGFFYNLEVFKFIADSIDKLCDLNNKGLLVPSLKSFLNLDSGEGNSKRTSLIYEIAMKTATYAKTIPYLFSLIETPETCKSDKNFKRWIRTTRNLVLNSDISSKNISNVFDCLAKFSETLNNNSSESFYSVIARCESSELKGFYSNQIEEELEKARKIAEDSEWEKKISEAEDYAFFCGAIRFLFSDAKGNMTDWKHFKEKWENAQNYFNEKGVSEDFVQHAKLLRALISRCNDFWGKLWKDKTIFNNQKDNWKQILLSTDWKQAVNEILLGNTNLAKNDDTNITDWCKDKSLFSYIAEKRPNAWIRTISHGYFAFWGSHNKSYLIPKIDILLMLKRMNTIKYRDVCRIPKSDYATCTKDTDSGIDFIYEKNNFRYYLYPNENIADVYLLNADWGYEEMGKVSDNDHKSYFCFDVKEEMNNNLKKFTDELDKLIERHASKS